MITEENKINIRMNLAVALKDRPLSEVKEVAEWIIGQPSGILPVSSFEVVKK